ncbi:branched-chain amino acid ABC transporter permease [Bradyrhizobium sp.]|jgi:branched-chain amino acid transport system permease protein|uniref:branched-chain amino acid ABC transporter permease n=1 Tax=Bradyrhizobium sp. TaxID=376 RepID=UPI001D8A7A3C|nr:branched-chain amino acid ABC transporter permease [Bradyrhizobium sp.]MBI5317832.1 branched-chain amino acid ABC transporter permease [Bradyrhizobium sp.]
MNAARFFALIAILGVAVACVGYAFPAINFLLAVALSKGLAVLGLVMMMRAGLVSFGQGLFYAIGGYTAGILSHLYKVHEASLLIGAAVLLSTGLALVVSFLIARYRDIFFAMLTLALSMILYGLLVKSAALGGTDGFNVKSITFLGMPIGGTARYSSLLVVLGFALGGIVASYVYSRTAFGRLAEGLKENEIRVEYLGASADLIVRISYVGSAVLAAIGGALAGILVGHVDPEMAFWATSGEFVVIAVLGGSASLITPFAAALVLEFVRSYATQYAPNTWQLVLGVIIFALILFLPAGLAGLHKRRKHAKTTVGA